MKNEECKKQGMKEAKRKVAQALFAFFILPF
jgi:hypothetical protein